MNNYYTIDGRFVNSNNVKEPFIGVFGLQTIKNCQASLVAKDNEWTTKITQLTSDKDNECNTKLTNINNECNTRITENNNKKDAEVAEMKTNSDKMKTEIETLKETNKKQSEELEKLRTDVATLTTQKLGLENTVRKMTIDLNSANSRIAQTSAAAAVAATAAAKMSSSTLNVFKTNTTIPPLPPKTNTIDIANIINSSMTGIKINDVKQ